MPVHIGSRYTREHTVLRLPGVYEECNAPCNTQAEARIQNALLARVHERSDKPTLLTRVLGGVALGLGSVFR